MNADSYLRQIDQRELIYLVSSGALGFAMGAASAYLDGGSVLNKGAIFAMAAASKYALLRFSEMQIYACEVDSIPYDIDRIRERCFTGNLVISAALASVESVSLGIISAGMEIAGSALLSYSIPLSRHLERATHADLRARL